eukprot:5552288-Pleurochrysis_carterae.AAC.1
MRAPQIERALHDAHIFQLLLFLHSRCCISERGIPIVPINIQGGGYDFDAARNFLSDMENELKKVDVGALKVLKKELNARGFDVQHLQASSDLSSRIDDRHSSFLVDRIRASS